jgi:NAD(P)-dependent dehydrogenase (short-subunit alcohol dehydrogenase family)
MSRQAERSVVVTGGGGALGTAVVERFLADGAAVIAVDRDLDVLERLDSAVHKAAANLTDPDEVEAAFDRIVQERGTPTAVVHTVGAFRDGSAIDSEVGDYRMLQSVNVDTAWWVSRAAGRRMAAAGGGALVHIGARQGVEPMPGAAAYSVSKAALVHLVRVLSAEWRPSRVRVNCLLPGVIDTAANRAVMSADAMTRAVTPAAIAEVITFLTGAAAAPISGAVIPVYG